MVIFPSLDLNSVVVTISPRHHPVWRCHLQSQHILHVRGQALKARRGQHHRVFFLIYSALTQESRCLSMCAPGMYSITYLHRSQYINNVACPPRLCKPVWRTLFWTSLAYIVLFKLSELVTRALAPPRSFLVPLCITSCHPSSSPGAEQHHTDHIATPDGPAPQSTTCDDHGGWPRNCPECQNNIRRFLRHRLLRR